MSKGVHCTKGKVSPCAVNVYFIFAEKCELLRNIRLNQNTKTQYSNILRRSALYV